MKKGNLLIVFGVLLFLVSLVLIRWSTVSAERFVFGRQTLIEYPAPVPSPVMLMFPAETRCGINLTGPFLDYTQGEPVIRVVDPLGSLIYSRSIFPPPSINEFDSNVAGSYLIDFNIVFGEGGSAEIYYYFGRTETFYPNGWAYLPSVFSGAVGVVVSAVGAFISYREPED